MIDTTYEESLTKPDVHSSDHKVSLWAVTPTLEIDGTNLGEDRHPCPSLPTHHAGPEISDNCSGESGARLLNYLYNQRHGEFLKCGYVYPFTSL
jgi:hypothetical protein